MLKFFIDIWKYLIELTPVNRTNALMLGMILLFGYATFYLARNNEYQYKLLKIQYEERLDTCDSRYQLLLVQYEKMQKELYEARLETASNELEYIKNIYNKTENSKKTIISKVSKIQKQQKLIKNRINK